MPSGTERGSVAVRVYGILLRLYPAAFRRRYGPEMADIFAMDLAGIANASPLVRVRFLASTITDLAGSGLATHWDALTRRARFHQRLVGPSAGFVSAELMLVTVPLWTVLRVLHQGVAAGPGNALLGLGFAASHAGLLGMMATAARCLAKGGPAFRHRARAVQRGALRSFTLLTALLVTTGLSIPGDLVRRAADLGARHWVSWAALCAVMGALPLIFFVSEPILHRREH